MKNSPREDPSTHFATVKGSKITPSEFERIQTTLHKHAEYFQVGKTSILVLGHYGDTEKPRLTAVRDLLRDSGNAAHLLDDIYEFTDLWSAKFKLVVDYADLIIGIYEHSHGGHCWEAGYIDQPMYRKRSHIFYRDYNGDEDALYDAYNGMFWTYINSLEKVGHADTWDDQPELLDEVEDNPEIPT